MSSISIKGLSVSYDRKIVLTNIYLDLEPGKVYGVIGPNGAGKSTLFELLQRFYDPQSGTISLGGVDLRALDPKELRQSMALVPQQPALFSADVMHNIRYGKPDLYLLLNIFKPIDTGKT